MVSGRGVFSSGASDTTLDGGGVVRATPTWSHYDSDSLLLNIKSLGLNGRNHIVFFVIPHVVI